MKTMWLAVAVVCALASTAHAQEFGAVGTKVINGSFQVTLQRDTSDAEGSEAQTTIQAAPGGDYFIAPNVSLGGALALTYSSAGDASLSGFGVSGRVGYYGSLGGQLGIWGVGGFAYVHQSLDLGIGDALARDAILGLAAAVLLFQVAPHFSIGFGPQFTTELSDKQDDMDSAKSTSIGLGTLIAGWW
jgi:hypothetical protein